MTRAFESTFRTRKEEVGIYLDLVEGIEAELHSGVPKIGSDGPTITSSQQRILYANVYLHLYNLVEATISQCLTELCTAVLNLPRGREVRELTPEWRREWARYTARTHVDMSPDKRLDSALALVEHLIDGRPMGELVVESGGGGNWDDRAIEQMANRLGCRLSISSGVRRNAKRPIQDGLGAVALVRELRNRLAHGSVSFAECGASTTAADLRRTGEAVVAYIAEVVDCFAEYMEDERYLVGAVGVAR